MNTKLRGKTSMLWVIVVLAIIITLLFINYRTQNHRTFKENPTETSSNSTHNPPRTENKTRHTSEPSHFTLPPDFVPSVKPWQPLSYNLALMRDASEGLQLSPDELSSLKTSLNNLMVTAGDIQSKDMHISQSRDGNPIIFLAPAPENWIGVQKQFETALIDSIGQPKARYFLDSSKDVLNLITGDYGQIPRIVEIHDKRSQKADRPDDPRFKSWSAQIIGGQVAELSYSDFFPAELLPKFRSNSYAIPTLIEGNMDFDEPPPFLSSIIEMQK